MQKRHNRLISSYIGIITRNHPNKAKKAKKAIYGILPKHPGSTYKFYKNIICVIK